MSASGTNEVSHVMATSAFDCGGRCPLKLHVQDGKITRLEGDTAVEEDQQLRACLRCRAYRQYVYHPDRLKYPMKRVGPKGSGQFERITWDEAYDTIVEKLKYYIENHGNSSVFLATGGGYLAPMNNGAAAIGRLLNQIGGYSTHYGNVSSEGAVWACLSQYGSVMVGNSREDLLNSKLIIMWGWDPARMISGTNTMYHVIKAKENGARVISVDPRFSESAAVLADQWIPVRPGTDTAMMAAMANIMIKENLHDQAFLDKFTVGFDKFSDYVTGVEDGVEKTAEWAEEITGVPADVITDLAREYATTKPAALMDCQGPARTDIGEQYNRCAMTLCAMTGNVGVPGGSAGGGLMGIPVGHMFFGSGIPPGKNPAEAGGPSVRGSLDLKLRLAKRVHSNKIHDAMLKGKAGGYPFDIKMVWSVNNNHLNQLGDSNKAAEAYKAVEFMVVPELFMTPTARYADIVLPATSSAEREDTTRPWPSGPYYCYSNQAIEEMDECKSDFDMVADLAERLGIENFNPLTKKQYLEMFITKNPETGPRITDFEKFKREGVYRVQLEKPIIAFQKQVEDPENNPFETPSGKIEIFSQRAEDIGNPELVPSIPKYRATKEGYTDELREQYPLQLITPHPKNRYHSSLYLVPWLREVEPHRAWINTGDAQKRGIKNGDEIYVWNDRGKIAIEAFVTGRIVTGCIAVTEGAWYAPDEEGIDRGGCPNTLTRDDYSPGGACILKTALVEAEKA